MFDDLKAHFLENVIESYVQFRSIGDSGAYGKSRDLRASVVAATAMYHFREHLPDSIRRSRAQTAALCPSYELLGDIVNAAKHRSLTRGQPQLASAEDLYEQVVVTQYEDASGQYWYAEKVVVVRLADGSQRDALDILTDVVNVWGKELEDGNVLDSFKSFEHKPSPGSSYITREEAQSLGMELIQGVRFKQSMQLLKYDRTRGSSRPIDLTDCEVAFRVHRPAYSVDIELANDRTGTVIKQTIDLTDEQAAEFHLLDTDDERRAFITRLVTEDREALARLASELGAVEGKSSGKPEAT